MKSRIGFASLNAREPKALKPDGLPYRPDPVRTDITMPRLAGLPAVQR